MKSPRNVVSYSSPLPQGMVLANENGGTAIMSNNGIQFSDDRMKADTYTTQPEFQQPNKIIHVIKLIILKN